MRHAVCAVLVLTAAIRIGPVLTKANEEKAASRPSKAVSEDTVSREDFALLSEYTGEVEIPPGLLKAYARFVLAAKDPKGTAKSLEAHCLPRGIQITDARRPNPEYGRGLNMPFLQTQFSSKILSITELPDGCYGLGTGTSYFCWVQTKSGVWKLYRASDCPAN